MIPLERSARLHSQDLLRGIAILVMLVIHRLHYDWPPLTSGKPLAESVSSWQVPIVVLVVILFTMAGVFYLMSGTVNAYAKARRTRAAGGSVRPLLKLGLFQGAFLLLLHYAYRLLLANGTLTITPGEEPRYPIGQLSGLVRAGEPVPFFWSLVTSPGTLSLLGLVTLITTVLLALLFRNGGVEKRKRNERVLAGVGVAVIVLYPLVAAWAKPAYAHAYESGDYLSAFLTGHLAQVFGLFPHLGIALIGFVVGLRLVDGFAPPRLLRQMKRVAWSSIGLALLGVIVLAATGTRCGRESPITGGLAALAGIGIFLLYQVGSLRRWEFSDEGTRQRRLRGLAWLTRLGRLSLTVYLFEAVLGEVVHFGLGRCFGAQFSDSLLLVLLMGLLCVAIWAVLTKLWARVGGVGSVEWCYAWMARWITGERTTRLDVDERDL